MNINLTCIKWKFVIKIWWWHRSLFGGARHVVAMQAVRPIAVYYKWQFLLLVFCHLPTSPASISRRQVFSIAILSGNVFFGFPFLLLHRHTFECSVGSVPPFHNIIIMAQQQNNINATQSRSYSTNVNWNLIAFQWKLMLQKMKTTEQ